jgi:hypothetical protein
MLLEAADERRREGEEALRADDAVGAAFEVRRLEERVRELQRLSAGISALDI